MSRKKIIISIFSLLFLLSDSPVIHARRTIVPYRQASASAGPNSFVGAKWNKDGSHILTWSSDNNARLWDGASGKLLLILPHQAELTRADFNPAETQILTLSRDRMARIWDAKSGKLLFTLDNSDSPSELINSLWSAGGSTLLTWPWSSGRRIRVWDATNGSLLYTLDTPPFNEDIGAVVWSPDEKRLLTTTTNTFSIWDTASGKLLSTTSAEAVNFPYWSGDGKRILTAAPTEAIVWDMGSGKALLRLPQGEFMKRAIWNKAATRIVTLLHDESLHMWDATTGNELFSVRYNNTSLWFAAWNKDETRLLSVDDNGAYVYDASSGQEIFALNQDETRDAAWNQDETRLFSTSYSGTLSIWDAKTGKKLSSFQHPGYVYAQWNVDGKRLLTTAEDNFARVWDSTTGKELLSLKVIPD